MISGIVYFDEIIEEIKDVTGIENLRPYYDRIRRFIFKVEQEIGGGGLIVRKKRSYIDGDGYYDLKTIIMPDDFVGEFSYGSLTAGNLVGKLLTLYYDGPSEIDLRYMGFLLDEQGNPFTTRNHLTAVVAFSVYRLYSSRMFLKQGNMNLYKTYQEEYHNAIGEARGEDAFPTEEQWNQIGRTLNGGIMEAMTNCGMKGFDTGDNDPMYVDVEASNEICQFTAKIYAESNNIATVSGTLINATP